MIRKPDQSEFRESGTVSALRDARTLATEGARGVTQGSAKFVGWCLGGVMIFGFVMSLISHLDALGLLLLGGIGIAAFVKFQSGRSGAAIGGRIGAPAEAQCVVAPGEAAAGTYDLSVAAIGRAAAKCAIPGILLFPTRYGFGYMAPLTILGVILCARAILLLLRLRGDRTVLRFDDRALSVRGLLGETTMLWDDVTDVSARTFSRLNLKVLFTSGGRRNIIIEGSRNRLGGATTLLVPIDLIGLDSDAIVTLVKRLLMQHAGAPVPVDRVVDVANPAVVTPQRSVVDMPFDADAIMARYMAEREQLVAAQRPDLVPAQARRSFGRKRV